VLLAVVPTLSCSDSHTRIANLDSEGTGIVCFGDSITSGYGVERDQAFPALISERLNVPVINAGVDGDTTHNALARLERDVLAHDPRIVIVEFGGNDFRKKVSKQETFANLDTLVERITAHGAMVVMLEIHIGLLRDHYLAGYKRVAKKHGAMLIPDFMDGILGNQTLTLEGIHPNAEGHKLIADRVVAHLAPLLPEADRARAARRQTP
jgi:acyl-CoA thioesterase-1